MASDLDSGGESAIESRRRRTFRIRLWAGVAGLLAANAALYQWGQLGAKSAWGIVWALVSLIPLAWLVIVVVLRVRQMDEYQAKLLIPGLAVGFTVAMVTAITLGSLSAAGLSVPGGAWPVALAGLLAWAITSLATDAPRA